MKLANRASQSFRFLRLYSRFRPPRAIFTEPPPTPLGIKLELTYACNLRCGFCYTDSPRRTLQRSTDLPDEAWRRIVSEALDLGIVESVVTGGEPLLRRELTLEVIETLSRHGVGIAFNTNGWFLDEEVVDRLAAVDGLTVHLSLDGAAPHLHDSSRGVPGSWRRAVEGLDRMLTAGVNVCVVHVITPENAPHLEEMLEAMWTLGVRWMRPTPVVLSGAAARGGDWSVDPGELRAIVERFERRRGHAMKIDLRPGNAGDLALQGHRAPGSLLIRPDGTARVDSLRPFSYGNAAHDGVAVCWQRIREGWQDERVREWTGSLSEHKDLATSDLVPYLDDELPIAGGPAGAGSGGRSLPVPEHTRLRDVDPAADLAEAEGRIRGLALARPYRRSRVRSSGGRARIVRRLADGGYLRLNEAAGVVMDALDGGSPRAAAEELRERLGAPAGEADMDALAATRTLVDKGLVVPAASLGDAGNLDGPGPSDLPGMEPTGDG